MEIIARITCMVIKSTPYQARNGSQRFKLLVLQGDKCLTVYSGQDYSQNTMLEDLEVKISISMSKSSGVPGFVIMSNT